MKVIGEKLVLVYGLTDAEEERLNVLLLKQNISPCKVIDKNMGNVTIKEILNNVENAKSNTELPSEKLLLFNNFNDKELYKLIDNVREIKSSNTILAAVTLTSVNWTVSYLMDHLINERETYRKNE